jgi:hypothetical protein
MALLFTSEIKGIQAMDRGAQAGDPSDAAKHDTSCASSGTEQPDSRIRAFCR